MLPSKYRLPLRGHQEFFDKAQRKHSKHFVIYSLNNDLDHPRFAVIVPAKVAKKATDRNKLRRQVLGFIQKEMEKLSARDRVIYVKKNFDSEDLKEIRNVS